jgi:hypothetical protein
MVELCLLRVFDGYYMRAPAMQNQLVKTSKEISCAAVVGAYLFAQIKRACQGLTGSLLFCSIA